MSLRAVPAPLWFAAALVPMGASQILRLQQSDPGAWIFWDYAGRLGALVILAAIASARAIAFRRESLRMPAWEVALWVVGMVLADHYLGGWLRRTINAALPATVLGAYPEPSGWLYVLDVTFGIALVACCEEIVFRRCARHVFQTCLGDGTASIAVTSLLFGAYHWWTGVGNIVEATLMGVLLMLLYRRAAALWPAILAHYLTDIADFA